MGQCLSTAPSPLYIAKWVADEWRAEWAAGDEPTCGERSDERVQALRPAGARFTNPEMQRPIFLSR